VDAMGRVRIRFRIRVKVRGGSGLVLRLLLALGYAPSPAILEKWVPYSQRYLFNAIPDTNHNANPTNANRYSKGNPNPTNPTNPTNPNTRYHCE